MVLNLFKSATKPATESKASAAGPVNRLSFVGPCGVVRARRCIDHTQRISRQSSRLSRGQIDLRGGRCGALTFAIGRAKV